LDKIGRKECTKYADEKECMLNPTFMTFNCRRTCGACPKDLQNDVRMKGHVDVDVHVTDFINDLEVEMEHMSGMKGVIMNSSFFYMCFHTLHVEIMP
jgi:hypothetical protein